MSARAYLYINAFSTFGSMMDQIVLTSLILLYTHSALWVSLSLAARTIGGLLSSLSSGVLADRMDRRLLMIASDMLRALAVVGVIVRPTNTSILIVSFLIGFLSSFFQVGFSASIPQLFNKQSLLNSNSLISRLTSISIVSSFLLAGLIATYVGFRVVLAIDCASYLLSALAMFNLKTDGLRASHKAPRRAEFLASRASSASEAFACSPVPSTSPRPTSPKSEGDLKVVMRYLLLNPVLCIALAGYFVETFSASAHNLGIPLLAQMLSPQRQTLMYGLIWGVWGFGNVLATIIVPNLKWIRRHIYVVYFVSGIGMSLGFISFLSGTRVMTVLPLALLTGVFDATSGTLFSVIQQSVDNAVRGRVIGISTLINRGGFGIGFLVAPLILRSLSMPHMVWVLHGVNIAAMLLSLIFVLQLAKRRSHALSVQGG